MSYLIGSGQELFGSGGGEGLAATLGIPLLGKIPFDPRLRECADAGETLVETEPEAEASSAICDLAAAIRALRRGEIVRSLPLVS
jgi:ATP-binding protein involved in chromosome partitioning